MLPIAYCQFHIAYGLLPIARCLLPIAHCLLHVAYSQGYDEKFGHETFGSTQSLEYDIIGHNHP